MTMQMRRAFNKRMLSKVDKYSIEESTYDDDNQIVEGRIIKSTMQVINLAGNKFSQFDEGEALQQEDGGQRFSDFRTLYFTSKYSLKLEDKIGFKGKYYNVLQKSDEEVYGFWSFLIEKSEEWTPDGNA